MAITNYGELKTAVANWLKRSDLTSRIPEFIALAEDRIYTDPRIRLRAMETSADLTIATQSVALPTTVAYVSMRRIYISSDPNTTLEMYTPEQFWATAGASQSGKPRFFCIEGENLKFGPTPDATSTGKILYWGRLAALSADLDTNWFLTNARGLYLYGALLEAGIHIKDDIMTLKNATLFDDIADKLKDADKQDRFTGATKRVRTGVIGP